MPDMNTLMSDPTIRQMAEQFGRGAGGGGASFGNNNNGNNPDMYS
jgi:small glutamine-rich tetratricopeptide repeat-containing protein alpha